MSDSLIEKMIAKGVNINNFQEVFNFFHSIDAVETDLINLLKPYWVDIAESIVSEYIKDKVDKEYVNLALSQKLNRDEYNNHFKGLHKSYVALTEANIAAIDGDYAHIDGGVNFGRMAAIWDSDDEKWVINEVQVALNTDEMPEGENNLYFKPDRVKNTLLTGLAVQNPTDITQNDSIIVALAKLQAQLKNPKSIEIKWYKAKDVGVISSSYINPYITISGTVIDLEFAKINGMLWMRGGFTSINKGIPADVGFLTLNPQWKLRALKIGQLGNITYTQNILNIDSPLSENNIYIYSEGIAIQDTLVSQTVRVKFFTGIGSWIVGGNGGVFGGICLGTLINP